LHFRWGLLKVELVSMLKAKVEADGEAEQAISESDSGGLAYLSHTSLRLSRRFFKQRRIDIFQRHD